MNDPMKTLRLFVLPAALLLAAPFSAPCQDEAPTPATSGEAAVELTAESVDPAAEATPAPPVHEPSHAITLPAGSKWKAVATLGLKATSGAVTNQAATRLFMNLEVLSVDGNGTMNTRWRVMEVDAKSSNAVLAGIMTSLSGREFRLRLTPQGFLQNVDTIDFSSPVSELQTLLILGAMNGIGILPGRLAAEGEEITGERKATLAFGGASLEETAQWYGQASGPNDLGQLTVSADSDVQWTVQQLTQDGATQMKVKAGNKGTTVVDAATGALVRAGYEGRREVSSISTTGASTSESKATHDVTFDLILIAADAPKPAAVEGETPEATPVAVEGEPAREEASAEVAAPEVTFPEMAPLPEIEAQAFSIPGVPSESVPSEGSRNRGEGR